MSRVWIVTMLLALVAAPDTAEADRCRHIIEIRHKISNPILQCGFPFSCTCDDHFAVTGWIWEGAWSCEDLEPCVARTLTRPWSRYGGPSDFPDFTGCSEVAIDEVAVMDNCNEAPLARKQPDTCSQAMTSKPQSSPSKQVGDPVDLTNGSLRQTTTDIDLGGGLAFTRHYADDLATNRLHDGPLGNNWIHSLDWELKRSATTVGSNAGEAYIVGRPLATPHAFYRLMTETTFRARAGTGTLVLAGGDVAFTDVDGTQAVFSGGGSAWQLSKVTFLGQAPILVSYTVDASGRPVTTYTRGGSQLVMTRYGSAEAWPGRIKTVSGSGEAVSYAYTNVVYDDYSDVVLQTVTLPNRATLDPSDAIDFTYEYLATVRGGVLNKVKRAGVTLSEWGWGSTPFGTYSVTSIDEPTLDQPLTCSYTKAGDVVTTSVKDQSSPANLLATFQSTSGRVVSVADSGGPGVPIPFASGTVELAPGPNGPEEMNRWRTQVDANRRTTLFENYQRDGAPGRIVEGWVDQDASKTFSAGDGSARLREFTYHPRLDAPLTVTQKSVLNSAADRVETSIFDASPDQLSARRLDGFTLDADGAIVPFTDQTDYGYDNGRLTAIAGPRPAQRTEIDYDPASGSRSALRRYLNGAGSAYLEWTFSNFDAQGNPQTVTDPNGRATAFTYDTLGRVRTAKPPCETDSCTGADDTTVSFRYDIDGNLEKITFPSDTAGGPVWLRLGYDAKGNLLFLADSQQNAIVYEYAKGRARREARHTGFVDYANRGTVVGDATFGHDAAGRLLHAFNPLFADGSVFATFEHDAKGNPKGIVDDNGKQDVLVYDALDRLETIRQVRTATYETDFTYDTLSNVTSVTDAADKTTDLLHDDRGNLVETTSPDTGTTRFLYDAAGNLVQKIEDATPTGAKRSTFYGYDGLNRLTSINLPNDPDWSFTYDTSVTWNQLGRLASVTNGLVTTELGYTHRGDVSFERTGIGGLAYTTYYRYDAGGNRIWIDTPDGTVAITEYAGLRPSAIRVDGAFQQVRDLVWHPFGPWTQMKLPPYDAPSGSNTLVSARTANLRGQIEEVEVTGAAGTVLDRSYTYHLAADPGPNLDRVVDARDPSESRLFGYDALDRLDRATTLAGAALHDYDYDAVGNRTRHASSAGATDLAYEPGSSRLSASTGAAPHHYAHDAYGNRIYDGPTPYTGTPSLLYDDTNRLTTVKDPSTGTILATYAYDAFGRRVRKLDWIALKTFLFFYDTEGRLIHEVEKRNAAIDLNRSYIYLEDTLVGLVDRAQEAGAASLWPSFALHDLDPGAPLGWIAVVVLGGGALLVVARRHPRAATATSSAALVVFTCAGTQRPPPIYSWVHTDPLGTPIAVTSAPEYAPPAVVWRATYEPFGKATVDADPDGDGNAFTLNVRFPGQYEDAETGWHFNYFRTYDPNVGRYLEADPIGLGQAEMALTASPNPLARRIDTNLYLYAGGNPTNAIDPSGLYYCVYSIALHTMTCVPNDPANQETFSESTFLSGTNYRNPDCGDCRDNVDRINVPDTGPLPPGFYRIGRPRADKPTPWRRLTPDPRYRYNSFNRSGFGIHFCPNPRICSEGCIATPNIAALERLNQLLSLEEGNNQLTVLP